MFQLFLVGAHFHICTTCLNHKFVLRVLVTHLYRPDITALVDWALNINLLPCFLTHICLTCFNRTFVLHAVMSHVLSTLVFASICLLTFQTHQPDLSHTER